MGGLGVVIPPPIPHHKQTHSTQQIDPSPLLINLRVDTHRTGPHWANNTNISVQISGTSNTIRNPAHDATVNRAKRNAGTPLNNQGANQEVSFSCKEKNARTVPPAMALDPSKMKICNQMRINCWPQLIRINLLIRHSLFASATRGTALSWWELQILQDSGTSNGAHPWQTHNFTHWGKDMKIQCGPKGCPWTRWHWFSWIYLKTEGLFNPAGIQLVNSKIWAGWKKLG